MTKRLTWLIVFFLPIFVAGQDFSNKGKDFWVGYGSHCDMYNGNGTLNATGGGQEMVLYFATEAVTNITVSIPAIGYTQTYSNIAANTIFETPPIPKSGANDARLGTEGVQNKGIHITSDNPIVAYAHIYNGSRSGATLLFPTNTLGKEYYSLNMSQNSQQAYSYCYFFVVATDTGTTTIQVTPSANTQSMTAGQTYTYNLTQGQVFNALGTISGNSGVDLTGSKILSVAGASGNCKRIAVFSGSGKINLNCPVNAGGSADNYIVQSFPKTAWGKNYLTVPTYGMPFNYFRIAVQDPATVVKLNGVPMTGLINNFYYQIAATNQPNSIQSDKPVMVAQYITTSGACGNNVGIPAGDGDPEVIYLSPIEQNISSVLLYATPHFAINEHFISVLIPNGGTALSSFLLDGATVPAGSFVVHPQNSSYSYLQQSVVQGTHTIRSDSGFNASVYGYGSVESYGYNAGTNIKDLYQQILVQTQYGIESTPSVCTNSPFKFKVSLPYCADSIKWDLSHLPGPPPVPPTQHYSACIAGTGGPDSTTVVNGKTIFWYSLPTFYYVALLGTYPVTITTYAPDLEGCGSEQLINFNLVVSDPPVADFNWVAGGCYAEPFQFNETTPQLPKPTYHFWWDFGDPLSGNNNSLQRNPTHIFSTPGDYTVRFADITTPGCLSDTITHIVHVPDIPLTTISGTTDACINDAVQPPVTFTATEGTAPYTFYYHINSGGAQSVSTTGNNASATVTAPTGTAGTFVYVLDSVRNTGSAVCVRAISGQTATIVIRPDATISLGSGAGSNNQTVCINNPIDTIRYNIGGSGNGAFISSGTLPAGISTNYTAGVFKIYGTPVVSGVYTFQVKTTGPCKQDSLSGSITVTADATINWVASSGDTSQSLCKNSSITPIQILVGGSGTGALISAGGLPAGLTTSYAGGIFTISGAPSVAGLFHYTVSTTGPCVNPFLTGTIEVYPLPDAAFTYSTPSCATGIISFTDASIPNLGLLAGWQWDFGDPGSGPLNSSTLQYPVHVFSNPGVYNVSLTVTTDHNCTSNPPAVVPVTIYPRPKAGFIIPEVCLNDTYAQFIDTSSVGAPSTIISWRWNFGDPGSGPLNTSTLQNPQHSYSAVGTYNVQLIITTSNGCKDTILQVLTVNGSFPVANFTVNNPATLCANDSVAITNTSTVFPGQITKVEIYWDNLNQPGVFQLDDYPYSGKIYRHLYPNFQSPLTKNFTIRFRAYSGGVCVNDKLQVITVNAAPKVQFNAIPNTCLLVPPYQLTQAAETGGVPGSGVYSGPGITAPDIFAPQVAGVGTHTILYTYTSGTGGCLDTMSQTVTVLDTAHAFFTHQLPICENAAASFTESSSVPSGVTLSNTIWDFGDGGPLENHAPGSTFNHVFVNPGLYLVKMYSVSAAGCNSTVYTEAIRVDSNHHITLTSGNNIQTRCINTAIAPIIYQLSGGATGVTISNLPPGLSYVVNGTILTISGAPSSTAASPYNFTITTTGNSCVTDFANGTITVEPDHSIALISSVGTDTQSVCVNTAIADIRYQIGGGATGATVTGLPPGVNFSLNAGILTISGNPSTTAGGPYFSFQVTTQGNSCLQAQASGRIRVNPYPVPDFITDKTTYCLPNAVVGFINKSTIEDGSLMTYEWNFGDGSALMYSVNALHQYLSTGPFPVKLTVRSNAVLTPAGNGCVHDTTILLTSIHPQPKADFITDKPTSCQFQQVLFTDKSDGKDALINQWHWDMGDGSILLTNPVSHAFNDTTTYQVTFFAINTNGCNSDTITRPFIVYPYPHVNAGPDRYILEGGTIILQPDVFANDPLYTWTPNQYLDDNKLLHVKVVRPLTDMTYTLTVTGRGGCQQSDQVFIKLLKFPIIPNTFTPNNDGINDTWRIDYLNTYPNNRVQVFSRSGQLVFESYGYSQPWDGTFKGKPLPVDTYYYIIEPGSGRDPITGYVTIVK